MTVTETRLFKEIMPFLEKYGIEIKNWENCKKHKKVWVTDGMKTAIIIVSTSPSDHRAYQNIAKSARKAIREAH